MFGTGGPHNFASPRPDRNTRPNATLPATVTTLQTAPATCSQIHGPDDAAGVLPLQLISGLEACTSLEELHVSGQHLPPLPPLPPSQPTHSSTSPPAPPHRQAVQLDHAIASATHSTTTHTTPTHTTHNLTTHNLTTTTQTHASPGASPPPRAPSSLGTPPPPAGPPLEFDPASVAAISRTLRVLSCNACRLTSCAGLGGLTALRKLDLSHNSLARVCDLEPLLRHASRLAWLDLRGNPLCRAPRYREGVTLMGDSLATLDGEPILAAQREVGLWSVRRGPVQVPAPLCLDAPQRCVSVGRRAPGGRAAKPRAWAVPKTVLTPHSLVDRSVSILALFESGVHRRFRPFLVVMQQLVELRWAYRLAQVTDSDWPC